MADISNLPGRDILPYDFCLPIDLSKLENSRMKLVPFEADWDRLSNLYVTETSKSPELFDYMPAGPFDHEEFARNFDIRCRNDRGAIILAILLKRCTIHKRRQGGGEDDVDVIEVEEGTFAGSIGLLNTDLSRSRTEMGHIIILPQFQRTFVGTNAHGLLLQHCLDPLPSGLALRRVQWQANTLNTTSIRAAERMGYQFEGIMRWERILKRGRVGVGPEDDEGKGLPMLDANGAELGIGRHSAMLAICWDDWNVGGVRERVLELMER